MNVTDLHPVPTLRAVAVEQVRAVGLAIRREVAALVGVLVLLLAAAVVVRLSPTLQVQVDADMGLALNPEDLGYLAVVAAVVFPLVVWKGEAPWGDTPLWSLPVARPRHALLKVAAGWLWLLGVVAAGTALLSALAVASGGTLGIEVTRLVSPDATAGVADALPLAWTTAPFQWLVPLGGASAVYLGASALWLGTPHPWRFLAVCWVSILALGGVLELGLVPAAEGLIAGIAASLDVLLTGGTESLRRGLRTPGGDWVTIWTALPSPGRWLAHAVPWIGLGLAAVGLAAYRHREG